MRERQLSKKNAALRWIIDIDGAKASRTGIMNLKPSLEDGPNPHPQDADGLGARSHRRGRACAQVRQVARRRNLRAPSKAAASNPHGLLHQPPLDPPPHRVRPMPMPMPMSMPMPVPMPMPMHNRPSLDILVARMRRPGLRLVQLQVLFLARRVLRRRLPLLSVRVRVRGDLVIVVLPASPLLPLVLVLVLVLRRVPTSPGTGRGVRVLTVRVCRLGRGRLHLRGVRERVPARKGLLLLLLLRLLWLRLRRRVAQNPKPARRRRSRARRVAAHDARGHERRKHRPLRAVSVRDAHRRRARLLLLLLVRGLLRGVREVRLRVRVHGRLCLWLARVRGGERRERPIVHLRLLLLLLLLWLLRLLWRDVLRLGGRRRM